MSGKRLCTTSSITTMPSPFSATKAVSDVCMRVRYDSEEEGRLMEQEGDEEDEGAAGGGRQPPPPGEAGICR